LPTSNCNFKNFSGVIPRTPNYKGGGGWEGKGKGEDWEGRKGKGGRGEEGGRGREGDKKVVRF
jgi:hypothetical protein